MKKNQLKPRKTPVQERARITQSSILDATARFLVNSSYESLTTNKIAKITGISVGSLYQYYPSKQAIMAGLIERTIKADKLQIDLWLKEAEPLELNEKLTLLVKRSLGMHREEARLRKVLYEQVAVVEKFQQADEVHRYLSKILIEMLSKNNNADSGRNIEVVAFILLQAFLGVIHAIPTVISQTNADDMERELIQLITGYLL